MSSTLNVNTIAQVLARNEVKDVEVTPEALKVSAADRSGNEGYVSFSDILGYKSKIDKHFRVYKKEDWPEEIRGLIPEPNPLIKLDEEFALAILMSIECNTSILAYGPPGCGKTVTPREVCARIGYPYLYIQGMGGTEPADYVGAPWFSKETGMEWKDAVASYAVRHGAFLLFDEPFKVPPQTNMCFQSLLDDRRELKLYGHPNPIEATLKAHDNFRICLCDNVRGVGDGMAKYAAEVQDQSTMDRMDMVVKVDYPAPNVETSILAAKFPSINKDLINKVVRVAGLIRKSWDKEDVSLPFSMRKSENWLKHIEETGDIKLAFRLAYLNGCTAEDEISAVKKMYNMVKFGPENDL